MAKGMKWMNKNNAKQKTIVFIMPRLPFPPTTGRKTSLYHYCRILSEKLHYRLVVAAFLENGDDVNDKPDFIDKLVVLEKPSNVTKIRQVFLHSVIRRKFPMQVSLYWNKRAKQQIDELIKEEDADIAIADMIRCTEYIKDSSCFRIADLDDMLSLRYKRQIESDMENINPYGQYISKTPKFMRQILLWKPVKLWVTKNEVALLEKYEKTVGNIFDATIFVAEKECENLNTALGKEVAFAVPNGVDINYFTRQTPLTTNHTIGFLGALDVAHNEQAVIHFVKNILPLIKQEVPDVKFMVIGGGGEKLRALESESVQFMGRVEDVRESLKQCRVFVCPMTFGSGIKTKLLEAMSYEMPIVTTTIGAENIDAENEKDWIVAKNNTDFSRSVVYLLKDYKVATKMGENGRDFVKEKFSWTAAERGFERVFTHIKHFSIK